MSGRWIDGVDRAALTTDSDPRITHSGARVILTVESERMAADIASRLGVRPTTAKRYENRPLDGATVTLFSIDLAIGSETLDVVDTAVQRLLELGDDVADRVADLASEPYGAAVLSIVQYVSHDSDSLGINLIEDVVRWLGRAHATIDIDQYEFGLEGEQG